MENQKSKRSGFIEVPEDEYFWLKNNKSVEHLELWSYRIGQIMSGVADLINYEGITAFVEYSAHVKKLTVEFYQCDPEEYDIDLKATYKRSFYIDMGEERINRFNYQEIMENIRLAKFEDYTPYYWDWRDREGIKFE